MEVKREEKKKQEKKKNAAILLIDFLFSPKSKLESAHLTPEVHKSEKSGSL